MRMIMAFFLLQCVDVLTCIGVYDVQLFAINVPEDRRHLRQGCQVCDARQATCEEAMRLGSGQTFYESPSDIHIVSKHASNSQPAKFLVLFVKDK
jgi:hypothetical protein